MRKLKNRIGEKHGKLTIIEELEPKVYKNKKPRYFLTQCECGNTRKARYNNLMQGCIKHCGCESKKHGYYGTRIYNIWSNMIQRCNNSSDPRYSLYGGRDIKVCDEWHDSKTFCAWAEQSGHAPGLTLDRVDNDGHYEPSNCQWVTQKEQTRNTRRNRWIRHNGELMCLKDYAKAVGLAYTTAVSRANAGKIEEVRHG